MIRVFTNLIIGMMQSRKIPDWWKKDDETNVWYSDYKTGKLNMQKNMWGSEINVEDSIRKLRMETYQ